LEIVLTKRAIKERDFWKKTGNKNIQKRISLLLTDVIQNPYEGIGKPEMLKANLSGYWSRRITEELRLVYRVNEELNRLIIISMRFHY
jgi:toxin YoeB